MKKICISLGIIFIIILTVACGCGVNNAGNSEYLRIHVRANSNSACDQEVKYLVRDEIVAYLTPYIASCRDKSDAVKTINAQKQNLTKVINAVLYKNGFTYGAKVCVKNEDFPTRVYEDLTLESGYYDAVIVELGKAEGDNWWCVVYPPMCFANGEKVEYRSKIREIIDEWKQNK